VTRPAEYDIVVLGASGATGREAVRYLAGRVPEVGASWAVAGRDERRCRDVLAAAGAVDVPVLEVDVTVRSAVEAIVERAAVVANLVGPYARFGAHVYDVCAATGTDQVDVCGEIDWLADEIRQVHATAERTGSRIVVACGFEALPFDLATYAVAKALWSDWGEPLASAQIAITVTPHPSVVGLADVVSGGTVRSGADAIRRGAVSATRDVRLLDPRPHEAIPLDLRPWRHPIDGRWLGPLLPTPYINPAIVYRTAGLSSASGALFSDDFQYRDGLVADQLIPGVGGIWTSAWLSALQVMSTMLSDRPSPVNDIVADAVEALGPAPGEGPAPAHLAGWTWHLDAVGTTIGGHVGHASVAASGHPGYRSTAGLVAEAALVLAQTGRRRGGGVLTPALALGDTAMARWRRAGCLFQIE
jgi:short subunit dehydrogenase-like uncharacterized protein